MSEDFDVEAMLEAPYKKEDGRTQHTATTSTSSSSSSKKKKKKRSRSRSKERRKKRSRSRSKERSHRDGGRERDRDKDKERVRDKDRSKDKDKERDRERGERRGDQRGDQRDKARGGSKEKERVPRREERERRGSPRGRGRRMGGGRFRRSRSRNRFPRKDSGGGASGASGASPPPRAEGKGENDYAQGGTPGLTPEERDIRTVVCMQLSAWIRAVDLEEFFSSVGQVTDVRMITDSKTRRSKGIAYIEFKDVESVTLAMALTGQRLLGVPIMVQATQSERNRIAMANKMMANKPATSGPMRLYVGSLHYNITEDMLKGIFEPFGVVDDVKLMKDHETQRSHGYGFLTFRSADDAKKAMEQLNGFELAGRPMKVGNVTDRSGEGGPMSNLDTDDMDRAGIGLGATGRLQLMAKLAEGTGFKIPEYAANALNQANNPPSLMSLNLTPPAFALPMVPTAAPPPPSANPSSSSSQPPIATQCFMLSNMFDLTGDKAPNWDQEIRDDVIEECNKHGGVLHIFVDKSSQGNVYIKCPTITAAASAVNSLHGRYFGGRVITAAYVPLPNYSSLFMDSIQATQLLLPSSGNPALLPIPPCLR